MQQLFHEIKINTKGQGFYDFTDKTISWINGQKIKIMDALINDNSSKFNSDKLVFTSKLKK